MANWRVLWQIEDTGNLYTVPTWLSCMVTELFIVNINWSATQTYTINVVKNWWTVWNANILAHNVQVQPWYFWDRINWLNLPLASWDSIVVDSSWDCVFQVFWYETENPTWTLWSNSNISSVQLLLTAIWI